jgi:hypothetical protein
MIRSLVIVMALCLCGTPASVALTMQECRAKYKAAQAAGTVGESWAGFRETQCGLPPQPPSRPKNRS